jgi:tetratricopeptide (TPR) repeat protein
MGIGRRNAVFLLRAGVLTAALFAVSGTAPAGTLEDCTQQDDWWLRVEACSQAIDSGQYSGLRAAWAYSNRAVAYAALGDYIAAFDDHEKAVKLNPSDAKARNNKANSHADFREYDRALREYTKAIELAPGYLNAHFNRAGVYVATGAYAEAIGDYSIVIKGAPDFGDAFAGRAEARCQLGAVDGSVEDRLAAIDLEALGLADVTSYLRETRYLSSDLSDPVAPESFNEALAAWTAAGCP